ncbi:hypothetical protein AAC387_Pa07g2547 [Persea americana]
MRVEMTRINSSSNLIKGEKLTEQTAIESFPDEARSEIAKGEKGRKGWWSTQADQSNNEKERRQESSMYGYSWELCNVTAGPDYIPCLDNEKALKKIHSTRHFQHRERHCPDENPSCLVPIPEGYKRSIKWPNSRDKIWYTNVPNTKLAEVKGHQNWVKVTGEHLTFPGGGTQFIHGALHYIDFIQQLSCSAFDTLMLHFYKSMRNSLSCEPCFNNGYSVVISI